MALFSKEHYELMEMFEREFKGEGRFDREAKDIWAKGHIYQNGDINALFLAFRKGYAFGAAAWNA